MADLSATYLGLSLKNPLIVSSSGLTSSLDGVKRCAEAGAGAVVLKSLFQEQIEADLETEEDQLEVSTHPEATEYVKQMGLRLGPEGYIELIRNAKAETDIPVIASLNCVSKKWWTEYAKQCEAAGADAIELNISVMPRLETDTAESVEDRIIDLIRHVRRKTKLPIAAKLGPYFSSLPSLVARIEQTGIQGLVLFNRFYQIDIDTEKKKLVSAYQFSHPTELYPGLRWISILSGRETLEYSASTGVHDAQGAVKMLLAGASSVQLCSALYINKMERLEHILDGLSVWMDENEFESIADFQGSLRQAESTNPEQYERVQYIRALTGVS